MSQKEVIIISDKKDSALSFLETVTYDEIMGYDHILSFEAKQAQSCIPDWEGLRDFCIKEGTDKYGWNEERTMFLGTLSNFHNAEIPCEDWRFNYFWALTKNFPEETLEEQFPTLKKLGDKLIELKSNALVYKKRMLEILSIQNAITFMYPLIHLEDDTIELPEINWMGKTVAWKNNPSRTISFIKETIDKHLNEVLFYSPTFDLREKFTTGPVGNVTIVKIIDQIKLIGQHGTIDLTKIKLSSI